MRSSHNGYYGTKKNIWLLTRTQRAGSELASGRGWVRRSSAWNIVMIPYLEQNNFEPILKF